jgi:glutamate-5-semialdehyde dehydrogenase
MDELVIKGENAKSAAHILAGLSSERKDEALRAVAAGLVSQQAYVLEENLKDVEEARAGGASAVLLDRLMLSAQRVSEMAEGLEAVCRLPDPVGECLGAWDLPNGLHIRKVRVPIGVIGMIYEARPNVTVDAAVLCLKTGNAVVLRGSSSAQRSNAALVKVIQGALAAVKFPLAAVQLLEDTSREAVERLLKLNRYIDVLIPRGGAGLIDFVVQNATVPVLETGAGNCHVYVDQSADYEMAARIIVNAKTQRPAVCNAAETLLVQKDWAQANLKPLIELLQSKQVECRGCERARQLVPGVKAATEADWETEFLDLILAVRVVDGVDQAIAHINRYGTRHSEAIVTNEAAAAERFLQQVDAAAVYHNASTRFTDGFVYGFGAEIGISTQKLHARGPMGLPELTSYKFKVSGSGQVR